MDEQADALNAIYNYEQITEWLGTSGQPTQSQFQLIADAGYDAVVNLALPTSDNAIPNESSIVTAHGMAYVHIPVDFENPTLDNLRVFFGVLKAMQGKKVWVHCVVNARVSAFVYHYLRYVEGVDEARAQTELFKKWLPRMDDVWRRFIALEREEILA